MCPFQTVKPWKLCTYWLDMKALCVPWNPLMLWLWPRKKPVARQKIRGTASMSRFEHLAKKSWMPFWMLGDPDLNRSFEIIQILVDNGADALELGIPFSDPIADGPVVQRAAMRALAAGTIGNGI